MVWKLSFHSIELNHFRLLQLAREAVALGIHIRADVVRDLTRGVAEAHGLVEGRGAEPSGPSFVQLAPTPEAHMVPLAWAAAQGLLEGEILFTAE